MECLARAFTRKKRGSLYPWLWANWDKLPSRKPGQIDWNEFADRLRNLDIKPGLTAANGTPLTGEIVRKTYLRVEAAKTGRSQPKPKAVKAEPPAPPKPTPVFENQPDDEDDFIEFKPMRLR